MAIPVAGLFIFFSLALTTMGEMIFSSRMVEAITALFPEDRKQLYSRYASLPLFLGLAIGSPLGGLLFQWFISAPVERGAPPQPGLIWLSLTLCGCLSIFGLLILRGSWEKRRDQDFYP
jgi:hypothetical protein